MGMTLASSFLPILAEDLDPSGSLVGLTVSAWFLSRIFIELPVGIISDRIGRRKLLIIGVGLSAFGAFLCAQAKIIYILIIGRAVWGLGTALYFMNNTALIIDLFDPKVRSKTLGTFNGIEFIGSFVGAPFGAFLAGFMNYTNVFYLTLALTLVSLAIALTSRSLRAVGTNLKTGAYPPMGQTFLSLRNWGISLICATTFFRMLVMQGIFATVFELYLNQELLFPLEYIGIIMSLRTAGHIVATLSLGFLSNKLGIRYIPIVGFLIDAGCLFTFTSISSLEMFLGAGFFGGFGEGLVFTSLIVLLSEIAHPSAMGSSIGLYRTFMDLGGFTGPIVFMLVYTSLNPRAAFFVALGINLLNIVLLASIRMKPPALTKESLSKSS